MPFGSTRVDALPWVGYVLAHPFGRGCLGMAFLASADLASACLAMAFLAPNLSKILLIPPSHTMGEEVLTKRGKKKFIIYKN